MRVVFVLLCVVVAGSAGCDLFGQIRCDKDSDCPDNLPFCNANVCGKTADDGRHGRGVGEGEGEGEGGSCTSDTDCPGGLCFDGSTGIATPGTCLPPASEAANDDCSSDADVQGQPREDGGPVIFNVQATALAGGDGCYSDVSFTFFQRGTEPVTNAFVELVFGGANITQSPGSVTDTTITAGTVCASGLQPGHRAGIVLNLGKRSNVACLPVEP